MEYNMTTKFLRLRWIGLYLDYNYKISDAEEAFDGLDEAVNKIYRIASQL